jgi:hypothetical protein
MHGTENLKYVKCILPPSCADCLEIWEPQPPGTLRGCSGLLALKAADSVQPSEPCFLNVSTSAWEVETLYVIQLETVY